MKNKIIIIIGSPRSGSSWLQTMIGAHPLVSTSVELTLFNRYIQPWIKTWECEDENIKQGKWYQGLPFIWSQNEFYDFLNEFILRVYSKIEEKKPGSTHILDKHPGYSFALKEIFELIPDALVINLIRDGRDVVLSMLNAKKKRGFGPSNIIEAATNWKEHVEAASNVKVYTSQFSEVKYEDLIDDCENTLKNIFDFCQLPFDNKLINSIIDEHNFSKMKKNLKHSDRSVTNSAEHFWKGTSGYWKDNLKTIEKYKIHSVASNILKEYGYADANWWYCNQIQRILIPIQFQLINIFKRLTELLVRLLKFRFFN